MEDKRRHRYEISDIGAPRHPLSKSGHITTLKMTDEEKEEAAKKPKNKIGFRAEEK